MKSSQESDEEIKQIFIDNKTKDLKKFLGKRACLNTSNQVLTYLFHIIQAAGILTTTVAAGYDIKELVWVGAGLNLIATVIIVFEKTNDNISKKLLKDIYAIKNGTYVDEGMVIEVDPDTKHQEESSEKQQQQTDNQDNQDNQTNSFHSNEV